MADALNEWVQHFYIFFFIIYSYLFYSFLSLEGEEKHVKLLIRTKLEMENTFIAGRKNKSVLWGQVLNKIKEIDPEFSHSKEQITRNF